MSDNTLVWPLSLSQLKGLVKYLRIHCRVEL